MAKKVKEIVETDIRYKSWQDNPNYLFMFRLHRMNIGDALISPDDNWRVDCRRDNTNADKSMFFVYEGGVLTLTRKRPKAVCKYLVNKKAPHDLQLKKDSALFSGSGYQHFRTFSINVSIEIEGIKEYWADVFSRSDLIGYGEFILNPGKLTSRGKLMRQMLLFPYPEQAMFFVWKQDLDENRN